MLENITLQHYLLLPYNYLNRHHRFFLSYLHHTILKSSIYIKTDFPRGYSTSLSLNSSKGMFINSTISSMDYRDHVQAQANNITWANGEVQSSSLFDVSLKKATSDTINMELVVDSIYVSHVVEINNVNTS